MKKIFLIVDFILSIVFSLFVLSSCGEKDKGILKTETLTFTQKSEAAVCTISIDYPIAGPSILVKGLREYINERLGDNFKGDLSHGDSLINFYGKLNVDTLTNEIKAFGVPNGGPLEYRASVNKLYETNKFITYQVSIYSYMGGAHGSTIMTARTFRKTDGRKFGLDMIKDRYNEQFTTAVKDGLKEYFKAKSDEDLKDDLLDVNFYTIPMPYCPPYLTKDGVTFIYQQYEIAPYSSGLPTFSISYYKANPFLINAVNEMVK